MMMVIYDNSITFFFDTFENTLLIVTLIGCVSVFMSRQQQVLFTSNWKSPQLAFLLIRLVRD